MTVPFLLLGLFVVVVGLGLSVPYIIWPSRMCFFGLRWLYDAPPEPSDAAIAGTVVRGIVGVGATLYAAWLIGGLIVGAVHDDRQEAAGRRVSAHLNAICPALLKQITEAAVPAKDGTIKNMAAIKKLLHGQDSTILTEDQWYERLHTSPPPPTVVRSIKKLKDLPPERYTVSYAPTDDADLKTLGKTYVDFITVSVGPRGRGDCQRLDYLDLTSR